MSSVCSAPGCMPETPTLQRTLPRTSRIHCSIGANRQDRKSKQGTRPVVDLQQQSSKTDNAAVTFNGEVIKHTNSPRCPGIHFASMHMYRATQQFQVHERTALIESHACKGIEQHCTFLARTDSCERYRAALHFPTESECDIRRCKVWSGSQNPVTVQSAETRYGAK